MKRIVVAVLFLTIGATPVAANYSHYDGTYCTFIKTNGQKITKRARFLYSRWDERIFWADGGTTVFRKIGPSHGVDEANNTWYFVERSSDRMRAVREDGAVMRCY